MENSENQATSAKDEYVGKRKAQIDKLNAEIEDLAAKAAQTDADSQARREHKEHVASLRQKRDEARDKLTEIEAAADDRWEDLKDGVENVWMSFKQGFEKVKARF
jgi:uncharacterized coiled-coil DUF342 family protein